MSLEDSEDDDLEVIDPENFRGGDDNKFNHQVLVMNAIKKCMETGSVDLIEGWWDEVVDKQGNVHKKYNQDTRKAFINSVKVLMGITERDYEEQHKKVISELINELTAKKKFWLEEEWKWWNSLTPQQKSIAASEGKAVHYGMFNRKLDFDNYYFEEETEIYRKIFAEINKLTKDLDDFEVKAGRA